MANEKITVDRQEVENLVHCVNMLAQIIAHNMRTIYPEDICRLRFADKLFNDTKESIVKKMSDV